MNERELIRIIEGGEDSFTEFKRDVDQRSDFAGEMFAFANSEGGQILVGVDDSGTIVGVKNPKNTEEAVINIARNNVNPVLIPIIDRVATNHGLVLVVQIPRRQGPPFENNSGQCFIRVGSTKRLASPQERARLLQSAGLLHFEETPVMQTGIEDLDEDAFGAYYRRIYERPLERADVPLEPMLRNMRLMVLDVNDNLRLSVAGVLLFGKKPENSLYHARISAVRWVGTQAGEEILDRKEISGRLPEQIEQAEAFILRNTRLSTYIEKAQQKDVYQYPRPAIREAIVNAVAHRDYSLDGAQILLYIFDDRIEIRSPGTLPNGVTLDNIRTHYSRPRNELISRVLFNMGYVNTLGSGIPRIIRLIKEHSGREPEFELHDQQFLVRLWS
jgi:ATP-dependent DNA helicase RecG